MRHLIDVLRPLLQNQLFSGGFLLMMSGAIMALCRSLPGRLWSWVMERFTITATIRSQDQAFDYVLAWLNSIAYSKRARHLEVTVARDGDDNAGPAFAGQANEIHVPAFLFTPSIGNHVFLHNGKVIWLSRNSENHTPGGAAKVTPIFLQTFTIRCFGKSQEPIRQLMEEAAGAFLKPKDDKIRVMVCNYDSWSQACRLKPRPVESVVLPAGQWETLLADCRWFLQQQDWYQSKGIPYRRGYLLEGLPGSGKTATVQALAGELGMPLYILTMTGLAMSDQTLTSLLLHLPRRSVLLLEDVDAAFEQRERNKDSDSSLSFSGLLNALDGAASSEGRLLFMTTNHVQKLDPALIRPGRCDVRLRFRAADSDQIMRLYLRFFPAEGEEAARSFALSFPSNGPSMAQLQAQFIERSVGGLKQPSNSNVIFETANATHALTDSNTTESTAKAYD